MKWKTLTKDEFPDIITKENIVYEDTFRCKTKTYHAVTYRSHDIYIIAMDISHMPDVLCSYHSPKLDDRHFFRMFQAEHHVVMDETGRITEEKKKFIDTDSEDCLIISLHDENLRYCKYKMMELESLAD